MSYIEVKDLNYTIDNQKILKNINIKINKGEYVAFVGSSGSGKSSLFRIIGNLSLPSSGEIYFKGKNYLDYDPIELRKHIHYSFQNPHLFKYTVRDNLVYPFSIKKKEIDKNLISKLLNDFMLGEEFIEKKINGLSGGEIQRVALIRSLLSNPDIILLDEVTSALDSKNKNIVNKVISNFNKAGRTVLFISHDVEEARKYASRIIEVSNGEIIKDEVIKNANAIN